MKKEEIINRIAREQRVERMIQNITHSALIPELEDTCQMIYLKMMEYDGEKIEDLWNNNQIDYFLARICKNYIVWENNEYRRTFAQSKNGCELNEAIGVPVQEGTSEEWKVVEHIIEHDLDFFEREIILNYKECFSIPRLSKQYGISSSAMWYILDDIKKKIKRIYNRECNN